MRGYVTWAVGVAPALAAVVGLAGVTASTSTAPVAYPTSQPATAPATYPASQPATAPVGRLANVVVTAELDQARTQIAPSLGAVTYTVGRDQIQNTPQGENAPFQQVLLRMPGVVMDSFGQEHVRGEHGNLTYRLNGVLLPDPLNGFGQELDTHLVDSVTLIDGSLPAQFGFRTAAIVDITAKSGANLTGGELSAYGGSYDTADTEFVDGGTAGPWEYFVSTS